MVNIPVPEAPEYPPCKRKCGFCHDDIPDAEYMFDYEGVMICSDCLKNEVKNMSVLELADAFGLNYSKGGE